MPNAWVESYHQTNETEVLDNSGAKIHDLISCEQGAGIEVDKELHPVLWDRLLTTSAREILVNINYTRPGSWGHLDYLDTTRLDYYHLYGGTYLSGEGVFSQVRDLSNGTLSVAEQVMNISLAPLPLRISNVASTGCNISSLYKFYNSAGTLLTLRAEASGTYVQLYYSYSGGLESQIPIADTQATLLLIEAVDGGVLITEEYTNPSPILVPTDLTLAANLSVAAVAVMGNSDPSTPTAHTTLHRDSTKAYMPNMPRETGSPAPWKVIADAT